MYKGASLPNNSHVKGHVMSLAAVFMILLVRKKETKKECAIQGKIIFSLLQVYKILFSSCFICNQEAPTEHITCKSLL